LNYSGDIRKGKSDIVAILEVFTPIFICTLLFVFWRFGCSTMQLYYFRYNVTAEGTLIIKFPQAIQE
jgi:hypothetical protein